MPSLCFSHYLKSQNAGIVDVLKEAFILEKRSKDNFMRKNLKKIASLLQKSNGSVGALMHKAGPPSNYYFPTFPQIIRLSR